MEISMSGWVYKKEKKSKIAMDVYSSNEWEVRNFS